MPDDEVLNCASVILPDGSAGWVFLDSAGNVADPPGQAEDGQ
jgi:hypothetical protein